MIDAERAQRSLPCGDPAGAGEWLFDARDPVTGENFVVVRCRSCRLAQTVPAPRSDQLDHYYTRGYHRSVRRYRLGLDRALSLVHRSRIRKIEKLVGGTGRVLDVGCGPGVLLSEMRRRGWHTMGTERSADAARQAREMFRLDVRTEDVADLESEGLMFDAVILWHVAEHLHTPGAALQRISRLLRPGGVLLVAVPNFASPEARFGRDRWFHLDVPRHLFHFTPATLSALVTKAGFVTREVSFVAPEYDLFSFVQTVENRLGLPPNLLYNVLRTRESRLSSAPASRLATAAAVGLAVPLTALAMLWSPLAAALGRSATVALYAQRAEGRRNDPLATPLSQGGRTSA